MLAVLFRAGFGRLVARAFAGQAARLNWRWKSQEQSSWGGSRSGLLAAGRSSTCNAAAAVLLRLLCPAPATLLGLLPAQGTAGLHVIARQAIPVSPCSTSLDLHHQHHELQYSGRISYLKALILFLPVGSLTILLQWARIVFAYRRHSGHLHPSCIVDLYNPCSSPVSRSQYGNVRSEAECEAD